MALFKKKCYYCGVRIEKGEEVFIEVKVPEFKSKTMKPFCSKEHAELYKKNIKGTSSRSLCPYCKN